jgi:hypothetical protein
MINCKPYEKSFAADLQTAFRNRDDVFFHREIKRLCGIVAMRPNNFNNNTDYDYITSRLHVCLSLVDSLVRKGETAKLMGDVVNF